MTTYSTGIDGLDRLLGGGFPVGSACVVQGPPGAGKTILANQFCFAHVRAGGRALYMTLLAESSARMLGYMRQLAFFDESAIPATLQYVSGYAVLERDGLPGLLELIQQELARHEASVMVIDGTFVAQSLSAGHAFRAFIHALQGISASTRAALMLLTHHPDDAIGPEHTMVDGWIDLREETRGFEAYRTIQVRKQRGARVIPGKHRFRIGGRGISVFPRIEATLERLPPPDIGTARISIGLAELDTLLGGGLPAASATLLLGPTGAGKTTIGMQFLAQAGRDAPALMLGFYETPARLRTKAASLGLGLDALADAGALDLIWLPPSGNIVDEVLGRVIERARDIGARRVLIDGLVTLRDDLIHPARLPYVVNALSIRLRQLGVTAMYTSEIPELDLQNTIMPSDELSAMVDNVLLLNTGRTPAGLARMLSVVKLRDSDFDPRGHPFHIGERGLAIGADPRIRPTAAPE